MKNIQIAINNIDKAELAVDNFKSDKKNYYSNGWELRDENVKKLTKLENKVADLYDSLFDYCKQNNISIEDLNNNYNMPETVSAYFNDCVVW